MEFQFNRDENDESRAEEELFDVHPMELVVQSVIGESLETLSTNLQLLHESQVVLLARIKIVDEKMKKFDELMVKEVGGIDIKAANERMSGVKKRLTAVYHRLQKIDALLDSI